MSRYVLRAETPQIWAAPAGVTVAYLYSPSINLAGEEDPLCHQSSIGESAPGASIWAVPAGNCFNEQSRTTSDRIATKTLHPKSAPIIQQPWVRLAPFNSSFAPCPHSVSTTHPFAGCGAKYIEALFRNDRKDHD